MGNYCSKREKKGIPAIKIDKLYPATYFIMRKWLQSYAYRMDLGFFVFFGAMLLALLVAILSVGYQAIRAARANPADSLRYE